ncbi:DJ-1/PfpI family protein [Halomarina oriensis]|uniref:DJ-1/PfpI family protein n=1 Tax=Halomarina oriensis TaxID=671145 RepID=A0A6B0GK72_9EURY|nr:DJ-1/PfpI family protein [Halomarina oriensis]MWG35326.1 DJ-1/PfpI family protein [Halomarina oriensis]
MDVQIVLYEGFDELDAVGPFEVFANATSAGGDLPPTLVTLDERDTVTASHGLRVGVDGVLSDPDLLVVPGGGWNDRSSAGAWSQVEQGDLPEAVARIAETDAVVTSVCTGGMILAHAGVLDGRPAVTHRGALDDLREFDVEVREERVVDDGDLVTAGGVTSGIDLALHLVERFAGGDVAERVTTEMEWERESE